VAPAKQSEFEWTAAGEVVAPKNALLSSPLLSGIPSTGNESNYYCASEREAPLPPPLAKHDARMHTKLRFPDRKDLGLS